MQYHKCPACGDSPTMSQERYDGYHCFFRVGCSGCSIFSDEIMATGGVEGHKPAEEEAGQLWNEFCEAVELRKGG